MQTSPGERQPGPAYLEKTIRRQVRVRPSQWLALQRLAFRRGTSVSEQVRLALAQYLRREQYR